MPIPVTKINVDYIKKEIYKSGIDCIYFILNYVKIIHAKRGTVPFELYDFQKQVLREFTDHRFNIVLKARQLGLSTLTAAYVLWFILFHKDKNVIVLATKLSTASNLVKKVKQMYRKLPDWMKKIATPIADNKNSLELSNGSLILALSTSTDSGRSEAASLLIVDEAAHVEGLDEIWQAIYPILSTGGASIMISCVTGDSLVITDRGMREIEEFCPKDTQGACEIEPYHVLGRDKLRQGVYFVNSGMAKTKKITCEYSALEGSLDHKLWIYSNKREVFEWCKMNDICTGDLLAIHYGHGIWGDNEQINGTNINASDAYDLGRYIAGDNIIENKTILSIVGLEKYYQNCNSLPIDILRLSETLMYEFIKGFLDAAAVMYYRGGHYIPILPEKEKLLHQVRIILLNFGILSKIINYKDRRTLYYRKKFFYGKLPEKNPQYIWSAVKTIEDSENIVYDFSLPEDENDKWCHSVVYNGIIGHQTPNGTGNKFYDLYTDAELGKNNFNPIKLMWDVHPDRDIEWFEHEKRNMPFRQIQQELMCNFNMSGGTVVDPHIIERLEKDVKPPIRREGLGGDVWIWKEPEIGHEYIMAADVAYGAEGDNDAFHILDLQTSEVVVEYIGKMEYDLYAQFLAKYGTLYNKALIVPENTGIGTGIASKLAKDIRYDNTYYTENNTLEYVDYYTAEYRDDVKPGFPITNKNRVLVIAKMEEFLRNDYIKINSARLINELKTFIFHNGRAQALKGKNDDLVMSLAILCWVRDAAIVRNQQNSMYNKMLLSHMSKRTTTMDTRIPGQLGKKSKSDWLSQMFYNTNKINSR